jgi:hypothetical protein
MFVMKTLVMKTPTKSRVTVYTTTYNTHIFQITPPTWATQALTSDSTSSPTRAMRTSAHHARRISLALTRDLTRCASPCGSNRKESRFHQRLSSGSTSAPKAFVTRVRCLFFFYKQKVNLKLPPPTRLLSAKHRQNIPGRQHDTHTFDRLIRLHYKCEYAT